GAAGAELGLGAGRERSAEGGAGEHAARLARLGADLALLLDLDGVDRFRWTFSENDFPDPAVVASRTREALGRFGADPDAASADEAAARVKASAGREGIVAALGRVLAAGRERAGGARAGVPGGGPHPHTGRRA